MKTKSRNTINKLVIFQFLVPFPQMDLGTTVG